MSLAVIRIVSQQPSGCKFQFHTTSLLPSRSCVCCGPGGSSSAGVVSGLKTLPLRSWYHLQGERGDSGGKISVSSVTGFLSCHSCLLVIWEDQSGNCCLVPTSKTLDHHVDKQRHLVQDTSGYQTLRYYIKGKYCFSKKYSMY